MTGGPDLPLTPDDVAQIVALLDGSAYETLELTTPRFVLRVARAAAGGWTQDWRHTAVTTAEPVGPPQHAAAAATAATEETAGLSVIRSPLPGVFYRAPQPGAAPFVEVDAHVTPDTVVGIIETMKMMNSVRAGVDGEVVDILARDGDMVAKDAALIRVRAST